MQCWRTGVMEQWIIKLLSIASFKKLHFIFGENNILTNNVNDQLKEKPSRHVGTQAEALSSR